LDRCSSGDFDLHEGQEAAAAAAGTGRGRQQPGWDCGGRSALALVQREMEHPSWVGRLTVLGQVGAMAIAPLN
jgi:hypothetical protein